MSLRSLGALAVLACSSLVPDSIAAQGAQAAPPRWKATINLTIGGDNATDDAEFGRISGLASDAAGRIFVADNQDSQIRVFSPAGALVGKIGRAGSGPMEFKRLATIVIGPDRLLWARDEGNARMQGIDVAKLPATMLKTFSLGSYTGGSQKPIILLANGEMIDETIYFDNQLKSFRPLRRRLAPNGDVLRIDTIPIPPGAFAGMHKVVTENKNAEGKVMGMSEAYFWQPQGPAWLRAEGPGGVRADAVGSKYEVSVFANDGKLLRTIKRDIPPVPLSARERQKGDSAIREVKADLPFGVPKNKPPIIALHWSQEGQLWVERATTDGAPREADVYDANGKWIAIAEWPRSIDLLQRFTIIAGRTALAAEWDSSDAEKVVRLNFR